MLCPDQKSILENRFRKKKQINYANDLDFFCKVFFCCF